MAHLRARIHPPWNAEKSLSPLKKFFPFQERRIAVTCSFFCEKRKKERRKGVRKRASSKGERNDAGRREKGRGGGHCFPEWAAKERRRVGGTVCL